MYDYTEGTYACSQLLQLLAHLQVTTYDVIFFDRETFARFNILLECSIMISQTWPFSCCVHRLVRHQMHGRATSPFPDGRTNEHPRRKTLMEHIYTIHQMVAQTNIPTQSATSKLSLGGGWVRPSIPARISQATSLSFLFGRLALGWVTRGSPTRDRHAIIQPPVLKDACFLLSWCQDPGSALYLARLPPGRCCC